jgi:predicted RNase H-like nuclease (RuvC/YqgF family)
MTTIDELCKEKPKSKTKLIVGIDPGITCGIAILSIDAQPILIESVKGIDKHELIKKISKYGKAAIIASDVTPASDFVKKIASTLNSTLFLPEKPLETYEKQAIVNKYLSYHRIEIKDTHSRDALAAAIKAYQHYKNKFDQIESLIKNNELKVPLEEIKLLVIKGKPIKKAIKTFETNVEKTEENFQSRFFKKPFSLKKGYEGSLLEKLKDLMLQNEELKEQVKILKEKIKELNEMLAKEKIKHEKEVWKDRIYQIQRMEIETLRNRLNEVTKELEEYKKKLSLGEKFVQEKSKEEFIRLKLIENFTRDGIEKASKLYGINPGDIVLLLNGSCGGSSTAKFLASKGIKAVVTCTNMAHQAIEKFLEYGINVIPSNKLKIEWIDGLPFTTVNDLNKALKDLN